MTTFPFPSRVRVAVVSLFSLCCCFIPLFNYLGYEFSSLAAILLSFVCGFSWLSQPQSSSVKDEKPVSPGQESLILTLIPLVVMTANAFFVKNCSLAEGFKFYGLQVIPAVLFSCSVAFAIGAAEFRKKKTLFVTVCLAVLSHILVATLTGPQIFAFNPIVGYFAGLTYDESLHVLPRLVSYRAGTLVLAFVISTAGWVARARKNPGPMRSSMLLLFVAAAGAWGWFFASSESLGHSSSEDWIRRRLGGFRETEHFAITYSLQAVNEQQMNRVAVLAEFQFDKLRRALRVQPTRKIQLTLYASDQQKGEFIGAAGTNISKPWLWQIHLNAADVEPVLKHELVHVMAAEFGFPLLRVAPNSGLIEGLAVALERVSAGRPVHTTAAEIYAVGFEPDVASLFSFAGFFSVHPAVSYSLAGSFCRFLIDTYGFRRFKELYRDNDFTAHYGKSKEELILEWRRFLTNFRTSDEEAERARSLFRRPSIFGKECARVIANVNEQTRDRMVRREYASALESAEKSLAHSRNGEAVQQKLLALVKLKRFGEAASFAREQFADSNTARALPTLRLSWGDALWALDSAQSSAQTDSALSLYRSVYRLHLSAAWDEVCLVRETAASNARLLAELKRPYVDDLTDSARTVWLQGLFVRHAAMPLSAYLYRRDLYAKEHWQGAVDVLGPLPGMNQPLLEYLRLQRIARSYYYLGEYERAKRYFWESQNFTDDEVRLFETREWIDRCEFTKNFTQR